MNNKVVECITLLVLSVVGILCMLDTPEPAITFQKDYLGNSGYPRIVGPLLILTSACYGAYLLFSKSSKVNEDGATFAVMLPLLLASLYIVGIVNIGFAISTALFLFCFTLVGQGKPNAKAIRGAIIFAVTVTAFTFAAFKVFKVYLPDALLF
ncbi:tripartite tricarboxylate transporter TctB family protein [Desulfovibrio sp. OttesenSCG-928-O18]|nr:tripartite tricarboxylate transporter TctB family protein [Desulfovibrio sp. OttesenSCG-928-O18]